MYGIKYSVSGFRLTKISVNSICKVNWKLPKSKENKKKNEAISAFNFFKTVDEIKESVAIDTDLKTWANAQGWKLSDESDVEIEDVEYDFDPDTITAGVYEVSFSTKGRVLKVHTTDLSEEGAEIGLNFQPEDIHVMSKVGY